MTAAQGPAPGFHRHPDHHISIHKANGSWCAQDGESVLAESDRARILEETGHGAVVYFPIEDVRDENLIPSPTETTCPFKGRAKYFRSVSRPDGPDIAWSYPSTYNEVLAVEGYIAFYTERISVENINLESTVEKKVEQSNC